MRINRKILFSGIFVAVVICLLFFFSGQSAEQSNGISRVLVQKLLYLVDIEISADSLESCNWFLRKTAHFTLFLCLGLGLAGVFTGTKLRQPTRVALLLGAAVAGMNECHQFFSFGRSPSAFDVCLDEVGVLSGIAVFWGVSNIVARCKRRQQMLKGETDT